jgi:hypothetical protein
VRSAGALPKHTTDDTPTCQCATDATRRTTRLHQTLHTLPRPSEDETEQPGLQRPHHTTPPPDAPLVRAFWGRLGDGRKPLRGPRYGSSNQEWNTVYKDQAPHRVQTHSTRTSPTVSDMWADGKVDQHTASRFARNSLLAPDPRALGRHPTGENCRVQTMEVELWQRPPTRRAEDLPPPNHPPQHAGCVFTRRSCVA